MVDPAADKLKSRRCGVEDALQQVYGFCPPTKMRFASDEARIESGRAWMKQLADLGLSEDVLRGKRLLDVGCGSCEKAILYSDCGAVVTGLDMTSTVLAEARQVVGNRPIRLVQGSLFDFQPEDGPFDIVISDGVLHHTYDTFGALEILVSRLLEPGGYLVFSLVNYWGSFWWFGLARWITRVLGGRDFHRRAAWGRRLFGRVRATQEGTSGTSSAFRSTESWAYDWFANPRWNRHSPSEVRGWIGRLGLRHVGSSPFILGKRKARTFLARGFVRLVGADERFVGVYWILNREPNMYYICARKAAEIAARSSRARRSGLGSWDESVMTKRDSPE